MFDAPSSLRLHRPPSAPAHAAVATGLRWRVNGFPASILVWTEAEYSALDPPPLDAQLHPLGIWVALRID